MALQTYVHYVQPAYKSYTMYTVVLLKVKRNYTPQKKDIFTFVYSF